MSQSLMERYDERIAGVLSCYDRIVITGTLPTVCYADGMTRFLYASEIRIFDYPEFAADAARPCARAGGVRWPREAGVAIEHIAKSHIRKEEVVAKVSGEARRASRAGACDLGDGSLRLLSALA